MSENSQLARTGSAAGAIIVGGTIVTGWWLLGIAALVVGAGAILIRVGFRRDRTADQR
ncbi:hypothetical protein [Streptomyces albipurpureus]|uniref:Peptidase n=1 Tax=Streptomyces albipurpureus TaxID=2897419 RepID=A0ABT0UMQ2_9ACTN|nr:hypothetical protein [Streptomyces sp. CWNU-1]MCM2389582.1 hypothetical protein [Streptomyces sp. CWNU-1]